MLKEPLNMSQLELWRFLMVAHIRSTSHMTLHHAVAPTECNGESSCMLVLRGLMLFPTFLVRLIYSACWESSKMPRKAQHH